MRRPDPVVGQHLFASRYQVCVPELFHVSVLTESKQTRASGHGLMAAMIMLSGAFEESMVSFQESTSLALLDCYLFVLRPQKECT
jgi:hypothetical protein